MCSAKFICVFSEDNLELLLVYIASGKIHSLQQNRTARMRGCKTFASSSSLRKNYFSNRVINEWNNLPTTIVNAKSVIEFEKLYDNFCGNEKYNYECA